MADIKHLQTRLFELRRKQVIQFYGTLAWVRLETEMNVVNDQINDLLNK